MHLPTWKEEEQDNRAAWFVRYFKPISISFSIVCILLDSEKLYGMNFEILFIFHLYFIDLKLHIADMSDIFIDFRFLDSINMLEAMQSIPKGGTALSVSGYCVNTYCW